VSATAPGGWRAGLERSWIGGATLAQESNAASPCSSAGAGADSLITFLAAGHTGVLIVEFDLTSIGLVSRTFPFGIDPARSAPPKVAARRTAQTAAPEKTDRSRMEFALRMRLSACVAASSGLQFATKRRGRRFLSGASPRIILGSTSVRRAAPPASSTTLIRHTLERNDVLAPDVADFQY
jgi:hypothetical protein